MMQSPPVNPMFHRHLVLGYSFAWIAQLSYLGYVVAKKLNFAKVRKF